MGSKKKRQSNKKKRNTNAKKTNNNYKNQSNSTKQTATTKADNTNKDKDSITTVDATKTSSTIKHDVAKKDWRKHNSNQEKWICKQKK